MPCSHIRLLLPTKHQQHTIDDDDNFQYDACVRDRRDRFEAFDAWIIRTDELHDGRNEYGRWCLRLLEQTLGLSPVATKKIMALAAIFYGSVLVTMRFVEAMAHRIPLSLFSTTKNEDCYNDMFSEPRRQRRRGSQSEPEMQSDVGSSENVWIKRPGNTVSNITYFVGSVLILSSLWLGNEQSQRIGRTSLSSEDQPTDSCFASPLSLSSSSSTTFWYSDGLFGGMMLVLAISSTLWHAWNVPWVHYIDLWSMDNSILYLVARHLSLVVLYHASGNSGKIGIEHEIDIGPSNTIGGNRLRLVATGSGSFILQRPNVTQLAKALDTNPMDVTLLIVYVTLIAASAIHYFYHVAWKHRYLHGSCGFSVRRRLSSSSNVWTRGHFPIRTSEVCAFASLPFLLVGIPLVGMQILGDDHAFAGSLGAGRITQRTLIIGWSYRLLERWALDGSPCQPSSDNGKNENGSVLGVVTNAVLSPTAILHWMTGVTLLAGYVQARSVELECLASLGRTCLR
eukprot:jgi/Psemu1/287646/fgenesh1_pg.205_\